jgi:arylsulfatase A-like enzyme
MMEIFAGYLEHTDYHIGRLLQFLKNTDEFGNVDHGDFIQRSKLRR